MENRFAENLRLLCNMHTQKKVANMTGFSQSSINNYINKASDPSIQFLSAIHDAFGYSLDEFMYEDIVHEDVDNVDLTKFCGSYMMYYYDNTGYKGEVHENMRNTLMYGVMSILDAHEGAGLRVCCCTFKTRREAEAFFGKVTSQDMNDLANLYGESQYYIGEIHANEHNMFINMSNTFFMDECYLIFNNPPSERHYMGGLGTINSVSRGREYNPCIQYILLSDRVLTKPEGDIYNMLQLDLSDVNFDRTVDDIIDLLKKLFVYNNELNNSLSEDQKKSIISNNLKYKFGQIIDNNMFRFAKISNREDDGVYQLLRGE